MDGGRSVRRRRIFPKRRRLALHSTAPGPSGLCGAGGFFSLASLKLLALPDLSAAHDCCRQKMCIMSVSVAELAQRMFAATVDQGDTASLCCYASFFGGVLHEVAVAGHCCLHVHSCSRQFSVLVL